MAVTASSTVQLLTDDVALDPLLPVDGALPVGRPQVVPEKLALLAASDDRVEHWRARLAAIRQDQQP